MQSFVLSLHMVMVWIILAAAGLALITGISLFFMPRNPAADLEAGTIAMFGRIFRILLRVHEAPDFVCIVHQCVPLTVHVTK